ncbi:hypothetical protein A671_05045 [Salmonella enterica subsp. enterica serovar Dublin str. DG22]|nr:hypothetical protein A671_05045 [Salmonella enterica subsp. enterica serovar Dublin str. DG22]
MSSFSLRQYYFWHGFLLAVTPRREHNHEENNDGVDGHRANCGGGYRTGLVVNSF